jgi:hypothetical protein
MYLSYYIAISASMSLPEQNHASDIWLGVVNFVGGPNRPGEALFTRAEVGQLYVGGLLKDQYLRSHAKYLVYK